MLKATFPELLPNPVGLRSFQTFAWKTPVAYSMLTTCRACNADFGELTDYDPLIQIWPCVNCYRLVSATRRPFRFDLSPCAICNANFPFMYPRSRAEIRCPCCGSDSINYHETAQLFMAHDFPLPKCGDILHGTFTDGALGAINVPDMAAIPIDHCSNLPEDRTSRIGEMVVTSIPTHPKLEREYYFDFCRFITPIDANSAMQLSSR